MSSVTAKPSAAVTTIDDLLNRYAVSDRLRTYLAKSHGNFIDGKWMPARGGHCLDVHEPSTGLMATRIAASGQSDIDDAVSAAERAHAQKRWRGLQPDEREAILRRFASAIEADAGFLAELESFDNGQPITTARQINIPDAIKFAHYMAGWPSKIDGRTMRLSSPGSPWGLTRREPVGVVAAITPWNLPFNMAVQKVFPALAAGCCVVLKPAEQTSLSALRLAELSRGAGLPDGVLNVVTGTGVDAGEALVRHPDVRKISFTGSTVVGQKIGRSAMDNMTRITLELGGKSPMIVLPDADLDLAAQGVIDGIFFNAGQVCCAASRLYVHEDIALPLLDRVIALAEAIVVGAGLDEKTEMGPLVSAVHRDRVLSYVDLATAEGGRCLIGGAGDTPGYFVRPTVIDGLSPDSRLMREEVFGPVVGAATYRTVDEALRLANDSRYGLGASVWSNDFAQILTLVDGLNAGTVWVNGHNPVDPALPFGGWGMSGFGREGGPEQLDAYLETKAVWLNKGTPA